MSETVPDPHLVGNRNQQENLAELLNSSASVSDISEAASDMSLSTSPGSDITPQSQKHFVNSSSTGNATSHQPKKRPIVRQLSSNPYLTSSEFSPSHEHLPIIGSHSNIQLCSDGGAFTDFPGKEVSQKAHSYPLNSTSFWESDEESDNGNDLNGQMHNTVLDNSHQQSNTEVCSDQLYYLSDDHHPVISSSPKEILKLGVSPTAFNNILDLNSHVDGEQQYSQYQSDHHFSHNHHQHYQQRQYSPDLVPSNETTNHSTNRYNNNTNQNELHTDKNSFNIISHGQQNETITRSGSTRSREVNSWGHFYQPAAESYYKYRRSHHCSDSEEEEMPSPVMRKHVNENMNCQSPNFPCTHNVHESSLSQLPIDTNLTYRLQSERRTSQNGMKPMEFKERFQLVKKWFSECNDGQRNIVLKGLLNMCEPPQLHLLSVHMSKELHQGCPSNCEDIITWLPPNLATKVISYLDPVSLCRAAQVCKVWRHLAEDQSLWRRFCCQTKWRLSKAAEHKQVISHMSPEGSIQWKNVFAERFRLRNNWLKGRCTVRTFEGHLQGISCVQFDDSRIVSGSSDKTIKVWNMRTNAPWSVQTLMGHHGTVRCLHLEGNRLVSGSCDKTIKVWDLSTQESWSSIACKVTMTGHNDTVRCLQADDDKVISGSYDKTLKIWDLKSGQLRTTLRGHQASVLCVHFSESKIVSGSADKTINVWSHDGRCMMTLRGHQDAVTCLMFDSTRIVSGSLDRNLKFWDIHTGKCLNTIDWKEAEGHTDVVRCLQADSWRVVSAADDKTIKVWNLATGERLVTLRNHTDGVTCLQFNDFIIVSGSYDKSVKLWDFSCC
ncbi:uncharacterized protein LOC106061750 [Biomphalaria glabrata]|uniref:Uncharacterized protein LOC106061750 n=1 Tax=Biomphalaria glabrata TaxID=6526 RepID=A0A9W3A269_BIOGL|nr:uncharacterized protein LOC106061750 [Biomphalaria glabrata]XP_055881424.1 uncharacterized protein LOC106061750 [Biomphalaria glabrata]XP_055881425.1 uncharacterized protein LOC106061750 [Biomphalaria glabrata]XP_055881427.1 uncharacterized protein LOC106061750 [Biomphalaria glabrata]